LQSKLNDYHHLQAKQLQSSLHKDYKKLKKKVQDGSASYPQNGHPCCILCRHYHIQQIDPQKPKQTALLAKTHHKVLPLSQPRRETHPSQSASSSTNAHITYNTLPLNYHLIASSNT
jgi:hypothetical protein